MSSHSPSGHAGLHAGAATADLTPIHPVFLFGYPHHERISTGVHDRLEAAALYLRSGGTAVLFIANDLIFVGRRLCEDVRRRIGEKTGLPAEAIILTATHTHSGPVTVDYVSNQADPVVPPADPAYLEFAAARLVDAGCRAVAAAGPAEAGLAVAQARGVGTNRHDPAGPADPEVPVLLVRATGTRRPIGCMLIYAMHPTVLHEDSTLISGDFPHFARQHLRDVGALPTDCPMLYHNGASGNLSPRHSVKANTLSEAKRLGDQLGAAVASVLPGITCTDQWPLWLRRTFVPLTVRAFPPVAVASAHAAQARQHFEALRAGGGPKAAVRTAECAWFGAEETVTLARAAEDGRLQAAVAACTPAEVLAVGLGPWRLVFWPGEFFVEYALAVKARSPRTFVATMANGELQGYVVTAEAVAAGTYEALNAVFSHECGPRVVEATLGLLESK